MPEPTGSEGVSSMVSPCLAQLGNNTQESILVSLLARLSATFTAPAVDSDTVTVTGAASVIVAAAGADIQYREITIQNRGTAAFVIRLNGVPTWAAVAGEIALKADTAVNDGNGGVFQIAGYMGEIQAITGGGSNANVSVVVTNIR